MRLFYSTPLQGGWPNGAELYALTGQAFDGTNLNTCAAITHTTGPIDVGNVDVDIQGLLIDVTGGYNNKNIKFASSVTTTKRRKITLKNLAVTQLAKLSRRNLRARSKLKLN